MYPDELVYKIALNAIFRYRVEMPLKIIENLGSAKALFSLERGELEEIFGKGSRYTDEVLSAKELDIARDEIDWCIQKGIKINYLGNEEFPNQLASCQDAPIVFYSIGNCNLSSNKIIAIVGTREASERGKSECKIIVKELAESGASPIIASGLAYGIDIVAHESALENGLETIAVLANPLDRIYPRLHTPQARKIVKQGALITEFPRGSVEHKINFVQRNRLIAGLSKATIVVESRKKGGALTTAELADSYSREVFALPGRITDIRSEGCNNLIAKNEATIFTNTADLIKNLGWITKGKKERVGTRSLFCFDNPEKEKILVALRLNPGQNMDDLCTSASIAIKDLAPSILELEVEGYIIRTAGNRFIAK
jgi:DNA processing protein